MTKKTVLITGASSGFGRETAKLFQKKGWNVIATMRTPEMEKELNELADVLVTKLDVEDQVSIKEAVEQGLNRFGSIDILVNNAGYGIIGVFESSTRQQFEKQFSINVFGLIDVTRAVLPYMRRQQHGMIINVASFGGQVGIPFGTPYISSKFAVEGFSEALSYEVHPMNITVKIVEPGASSKTNFTRSMEVIKCDIPEYNTLMAEFPGRLATATADLAKAGPEDVARTVYEAATDGKERLRYSVGEDGQFFIDKKYQNSDEEYTRLMHGIFSR